MYNTIIWGFDTQFEDIKKSKKLNIIHWIGKNKECTISREKIYKLKIDNIKINKKSYSLYKKIYSNNFNDFFNMCARHDPKNEKAHHDYYDIFNIYFNFFYNLLIDNNIDLYISSCIPHVGPDYLLYLIAKELNIKILILYQSILPNHFFYMSDIDNFGDFTNYPILRKEKYFMIQKNHKTSLPYMNKINRYRYSYIKSIIEFIKYKNFQFFWKIKRFNCYKKNLKSVIDNNFDFKANFVYFPLHLNPELTISSLGCNFTDQLLALERLSNFIPLGWKIYVKENPKQTELMRGDLFFRRIKELNNVIFVPTEINTYRLIENSKFVSTVTGTAGWEALTNYKNVLIFGNAWYRDLPGVFKYSDDLIFSDILEYKINKNELSFKITELLSKLGEGVVDQVYSSLVDNFDKEENSRLILKFIEDNI